MKGKRLSRTLVSSCLVILLIVLLVTVACAKVAPAPPPPAPAASPASVPTPAPLPATVIMAAGNPGGGFYNTAAGLAKVISGHTPMTVTLQPFAGPTAWMPLLNKGDIHIGPTSSPEIIQAFNGVVGYKQTGRIANLRLVIRGGNMGADIPMVVREDSDIRSAKDLRGKRIASDYPAMASAVGEEEVILRSGGLTWNDVVKVPVVGGNEGLEALRDGRVDASFGMTATTPKAVEVDGAIKIRPVPFDPTPENVKLLNEIYPGAVPYEVKAGDGIIRKDVVVFNKYWVLTASALFSEQGTYEVLKALWENYKELQPIYVWFQGVTPETMFDPKPMIPYHPAAVKFYKEKGLWTAELDQIQNQLLAVK